jgi:hypothetical protein
MVEEWITMGHEGTMKKIRLQGLVRLANTVRRELAGPISSARLETLRRDVSACLEALDRFLKTEGVTSMALPGPSRKAYQFLKGVDFSALKPSKRGEEGEQERVTVRFPGLQRFFRDLMDQLSRAEGFTERQRIFECILTSSDNLECQIRREDFQPGHLTAETRAIRGWLAYFAESDHFDAYMNALERAGGCFGPVLSGAKKLKFKSPALIQFQPMKGLYRVVGSADGTRIHLPTAMISFDETLFTALAELIFKGKRCKPTILQATLAESHLAVQMELETLAGLVERSAGMYHDLTESFERVNTLYFQNHFSRPRLFWTQTFTHRRFGSYDFSRDTLTVSATLDQPKVPEYVVDYIMYHELLHKKHGIRWQNGRRGVHTPQFQREEKQFKQYAEANVILKKLARR